MVSLRNVFREVWVFCCSELQIIFPFLFANRLREGVSGIGYAASDPSNGLADMECFIVRDGKAFVGSVVGPGCNPVLGTSPVGRIGLDIANMNLFDFGLNMFCTANRRKRKGRERERKNEQREENFKGREPREESFRGRET